MPRVPHAVNVFFGPQMNWKTLRTLAGKEGVRKIARQLKRSEAAVRFKAWQRRIKLAVKRTRLSLKVFEKGLIEFSAAAAQPAACSVPFPALPPDERLIKITPFVSPTHHVEQIAVDESGPGARLTPLIGGGAPRTKDWAVSGGLPASRCGAQFFWCRQVVADQRPGP